MARPSRYSPEVRERTVRMVLEHQGRARTAMVDDPACSGEARLHAGDAVSLGVGLTRFGRRFVYAAG
jgi:hypothetical protein